MNLFGKKSEGPVWVQKTHVLKSDEFVCSACGYSVKKPVKICPKCKAAITGIRYDPSWVDEMEMIDMFLDD